jgi:hypothetical protein
MSVLDLREDKDDQHDHKHRPEQAFHIHALLRPRRSGQGGEVASQVGENVGDQWEIHNESGPEEEADVLGAVDAAPPRAEAPQQRDIRGGHGKENNADHGI